MVITNYSSNINKLLISLIKIRTYERPLLSNDFVESEISRSQKFIAF